MSSLYLSLSVLLVPCGNWNCACVFRHQRGCCCASRQLYELEDQAFRRTMGLRLSAQIRESTCGVRVAFTASMSPRVNCFGPFSTDIPIPYSIISLNHGSGYNPALGIFTAPRPGLYSFSFSAYSRVRRSGDRMYYKVQLMRNGEVMASTWEDNREDVEDSSTQTVLLQLQRGGQVYVQLLTGRQLCGDINGLNTFSGYLLYSSET
uniref:Cerebellin 18 n=1 Tax=Myripristis murdjan TaxID=586833 RepID=A0A668A4M1_9TELE